MNTVDVHKSLNNAGQSLKNHSEKASENGKKLGKQDFLNLMMTQMAHQDPLDPMDSDKMMSQMAQLGSVEQLQNLNAKVDQLASMQKDLAQSSVYSFLDKDVELNTNQISLKDGVSAPATYDLKGEAEKVVAFITNAQGENVRSMDLGSKGKGSYSINWDGKDDDGDQLPSGTYKYDVMAKTKDGERIPVDMFKRGRVSGIRFENGKPLVEVNNELLPLDQIKGISMRSEKTFDHAQLMSIRKDLAPKSARISASGYGNAVQSSPGQLGGAAPMGIKTRLGAEAQQPAASNAKGGITSVTM